MVPGRPIQANAPELLIKNTGAIMVADIHLPTELNLIPGLTNIDDRYRFLVVHPKDCRITIQHAPIVCSTGLS